MEIGPHFRGLFSRTTFYCVTFCTSLTLLDIDECSNGSHDCDVNANFSNINGSHSCTCKEGYTGKGESCQSKIRLYFKKKQNSRLSQIIVLLSNKLARSNEQGFFPYYLINRRIRELSFHHYLEYFSRKCGHARITTPPHQVVLIQGKSVSTASLF